MNNLEFLQEIKSKICKIIFEDHSGYYVMIPFIKYNESLEYIENYKNVEHIRFFAHFFDGIFQNSSYLCIKQPEYYKPN